MCLENLSTYKSSQCKCSMKCNTNYSAPKKRKKTGSSTNYSSKTDISIIRKSSSKATLSLKGTSFC